MAELLRITLSVASDSWITLDATLGRDMLAPSDIPGVQAWCRAATSAGTATKALDSIAVPAAVQALVACPSLLEGLAEALWQPITGDRVLDHVRGRLFS